MWLMGPTRLIWPLSLIATWNPSLHTLCACTGDIARASSVARRLARRDYCNSTRPCEYWRCRDRRRSHCWPCAIDLKVCARGECEGASRCCSYSVLDIDCRWFVQKAFHHPCRCPGGRGGCGLLVVVLKQMNQDFSLWLFSRLQSEFSRPAGAIVASPVCRASRVVSWPPSVRCWTVFCALIWRGSLGRVASTRASWLCCEVRCEGASVPAFAAAFMPCT